MRVIANGTLSGHWDGPSKVQVAMAVELSKDSRVLTVSVRQRAIV